MEDSVPDPETTGEPPAVKPSPGRFAWGMALGVGIGAISIVAILASVWLITVYSAMGGRFGGSSVSVTAVDAGTWFSVAADGSGTLRGYSNSSGSGDGMVDGTFAYIDVAAPGDVDGVLIAHSVPVYIGDDTKLMVNGKPWKPASTSSRGPARTAFGDSYEGEMPFDSRELTIVFQKKGDKLIADSIDASGPMLEGPLPWQP